MTFKLEENERLIKEASVSLYGAAQLNRDGKLHLTNRRICFTGPGEDSFCYPLDAIISVSFANVGLIFSQGFTLVFSDQRREHIGAVYNREDWVEKILEAKDGADSSGQSVPDQESAFFTRFRRELREKITTHFSDDEIKSLCFDLGIEYENLSGEDREAKARELVIYCERTSKISQLVSCCRELRPNVNW